MYLFLFVCMYLFVLKDIRVDPAEETTEKSDDEDDGDNELDTNNELQNTTTEDDVDIAVNDSSEVNYNSFMRLFDTGLIYLFLSPFLVNFCLIINPFTGRRCTWS